MMLINNPRAAIYPAISSSLSCISVIKVRYIGVENITLIELSPHINRTPTWYGMGASQNTLCQNAYYSSL